MSNHDIIPRKDQDFDVFQQQVVNDSTANKIAWGIPDEYLNELNTPQAKWNSA